MKQKNFREINIYTVKFDSAAWLLDIINNTFYLFKEKYEYKINIHILDDYNDNTFKNYSKYFIHLILNFCFKKKFNIKFKSFKFLNRKFNKNSFYYKILTNRDVKFNLNNYKFQISKFKYNFLDLIYYKVKSFSLSVFIFFKYFFFKKKIEFLNLKIKKILVGPLIASTLLRESPKLGGQFNFTLKLLLILNHAIYYIFISEKYFQKIKKKQSYSIVPEPTYLQVLWKRILLKKGIASIETHHYKKFPLINRNYNYFFPWIIEKKKIKKINNSQKKIIGEFFKKRFFNPQLVISYMVKENSNDNNIKEILDFKNKKINLDKDSLNIVLFLHSFDDGQYLYGYDGFLDSYEWTIFTIDKCLANKNIEKILIKPHPGTDFKNYPGNANAFTNLFKRYKKNNNVKILKKNTSIINLFSDNKYIVGFTHHGSVAEELFYLNKKVIGFYYGPWGKNYQFCENWKNKIEYGKIISSINKESIVSPTAKMKNIFYNYILERKMNLLHNSDLSTRVLLAKSKKKYNKWGVRGEHSGHIRYMNDIKQFEVNNKFVDEIVKPIYKKNLIK